MTDPARAVLDAASNPRRMLENLRAVVSSACCDEIQRAIDSSVRGLFLLGEQHFTFAKGVPRTQWRQRISRFYYAAYNVRRALALNEKGHYSQDVSDHKKFESLPEKLQNRERYTAQFGELRDDRNLADYDHTAQESDLLLAQADAEKLVEAFLNDSRAYLQGRGLSL